MEGDVEGSWAEFSMEVLAFLGGAGWGMGAHHHVGRSHSMGAAIARSLAPPEDRVTLGK